MLVLRDIWIKIPTQKIGEFEQALLQKLKAKDSKILDAIRKDKTMSDETETVSQRHVRAVDKEFYLIIV